MRTIVCLAALAVFSLPMVAGAAGYRYVTDEGTVAYTDNRDQIPARYRKSAERVAMKSLYSYPRLSVVKRDASHARTGPGMGTPAEVPVRYGTPPVGVAYGEATPALELSINGKDQLSLPLDSQGVVSVQRNHWREVRRDGLTYYKPFTIIEQDGETIAEIEPR